MSVEPGKTMEVSENIKGMEGVKTVEAVAGPHDIVVSIEVDSLDILTNTVFGEIRSISGVTSTTTLIVVEI
ncbi:MAG: Lrp/AsnC ligand binding domain-containing protein [Hadesarchaea archaeon]|nr:Lrp/AsnC ligand binding domain-containing protein [Hadesarchaea archaeon]